MEDIVNVAMPLALNHLDKYAEVHDMPTVLLFVVSDFFQGISVLLERSFSTYISNRI